MTHIKKEITASSNSSTPTVRRQVIIWLWIGIFMLLIQIVLGGITRLTGSGLSITDWDPIMGAIPPLNHAQWMEAFHRYRQIPQFKILNNQISLSDFKFLFFWEYFHRLWARLIAVVFLIPFVYFLLKKYIPRKLLWQLVIAFLLGALQGFIGWVMVESGLSKRLWVSPLKLSLHLLTALILVAWMLKITLQSTNFQVFLPSKALRRFTFWLLIGIFIQIGLGALMAGSHAALYFPTWPDMNGYLIPPGLLGQSPWWINFFNSIATIQFFHRLVAYILFCAIIIYGLILWLKYPQQRLARQFAFLLMLMVCTQVLLGIFTLLGSASGNIPIALAVIHQSVGLLLFCVVFSFYIGMRAELRTSH